MCVFSFNYEKSNIYEVQKIPQQSPHLPDVTHFQWLVNWLGLGLLTLLPSLPQHCPVSVPLPRLTAG